MSTDRVSTPATDLNGGTLYNAHSSSMTMMDELQVLWSLVTSFPTFATGQAMSIWAQPHSSPTTAFNGGLPTPPSSGKIVPGEQHSVGSLPDDDSRLAQVLSQSAAQGKTYKQAIETLNGVNGYLSYAWKDYYLDNESRIDILVDLLKHPPIKTVKKPIFKHASSASSSTVSHEVTSHRRARLDHRQASRAVKASQPISPRNNIRLTVPAQAPLSTPLSYAPTPPAPDTIVTLGSGSNKFTEADEEFFYKFIQWHRETPLSKTAQCEKLAKLAPHHSAASWAYYWSKHRPSVDEILGTVRDTTEAQLEGSQLGRHG